MSLGLLLPAGLAALAALLLPLLLHLVRRAEQQPTDFAALRWLRAMPRPRQKFRFEEWLLLTLRLLLVTLLALLLARPVLFGGQGDAPWVAVAPGVSPEQAKRAAADLVKPRWHWLAPKFPALDASAPNATQANASLLRELDASLPGGTRLVVVVPEQLDGLDAERPRLSHRIDWRIVAGGRAVHAASPTTPASELTPPLVIRHNAERDSAVRYLRAAARAWQRDANIGPVTQALPEGSQWLAWLAPGPLPDATRQWIGQGGIALLDASASWPGLDKAPALWRDDEGGVLARGQAFGRGRVIQLSQPLSPSVLPLLLDASFPTQLRRLMSGPPPEPSRAYASAYTPRAGGATYPETPRPLQPWLAVAIALLFLAERIVASGLRRRASA